MNKYQDMKLGKILAIAGCKMVPHGSAINVVTENDVVVLSGTIDDIRERVAFNCHHYGEPIVHPSVKTFHEEAPAQKVQRAAAAYKIQKAMDHELSVHTLQLSSDDSGDEGSSSRPRKPVKNTGSTGGGIDSRALPENRVGALQERFRKSGVTPEYEFKETPMAKTGGNQDSKHSFSCKVRVGKGVCWGNGRTKKLAKQDAAGNLLIKIMNGLDPLAFKQDAGVSDRKRKNRNTRITKEQIVDWEGQKLEKYRHPAKNQGRGGKKNAGNTAEVSPAR